MDLINISGVFQLFLQISYFDRRNFNYPCLGHLVSLVPLFEIYPEAPRHNHIGYISILTYLSFSATIGRSGFSAEHLGSSPVSGNATQAQIALVVVRRAASPVSDRGLEEPGYVTDSAPDPIAASSGGSRVFLPEERTSPPTPGSTRRWCGWVDSDDLVTSSPAMAGHSRRGTVASESGRVPELRSERGATGTEPSRSTPGRYLAWSVDPVSLSLHSTSRVSSASANVVTGTTSASWSCRSGGPSSAVTSSNESDSTVR